MLKSMSRGGKGQAMTSCCPLRMLRKPGGKVLLIVVVTLTVFCIILFEGHHLSGQTLLHRIHASHHYLQRGTAEGQGGGELNASRTATLKPVLTTQPPKPSTTPVWQNMIYAERRHRSQDVCSKVRGGDVMRLTRFANTSYCVVPKVGCTFWLNVFRFLHGDTGSKNITSPFSIPRMITHYGARKRMKYFFPNATFSPHHLVDDLRFMFVRDPYSRLWSAYVDKFLLVDYWRTEGKNIVKQRSPKIKLNQSICANDISFKEFVEFVAKNKNPKGLNEHWKPILYLCSPCLYQPHIIGKLETFPQDSRYVLQLMNSSWILDTYDHDKHVYQEMDMIIAYNFQIIKSKHYAKCTNATDLSRRLWQTFQINGYIPTEMKFPDPGPAGINMKQFQTLAHSAYKNRPYKSSAQWRQQREQMMIDAFESISTETLERIKTLYHVDFELFGYDPEPTNIFASRRKVIRKKRS